MAPSRLLPVLTSVSVALLAVAGHGQAAFTATKTVSLDVFGGVIALDPKFGVTTKEIGYVAGADVTRHFRPVDVSFELRYTVASGYSADEKTYGGGLKVERAFARFHPYLDFLVEGGRVNFDHPEIYGSPFYTHDDSFVYNGGGGVDYDLSPRFALKVDFQAQHWKTGSEHPPFYPYNGSVGIVYRVPFSSLRPRR